MLSHLPVQKASVGFRGVDWTVEAEKSQQRFERRNKARQQRGQRKMSNEQFRSFLEFVVTPDAENVRNLEVCDLILSTAKRKELFLHLADDTPEKQKLQLLLDKFDTLKNDQVLRPLIQSWMYTAVGEGLYASQPKNISPSSADRASSISGLSDGTFETISLSSHKIDDDVAAAIIQTAVFAAYAAGKHRDRSHKILCNDFSKIFQTKQPEYISAMATAEKKTDWSEFYDGGGEASTGSRSSKSCIDELASEAYIAFAQKADKSGLTQNQIKKVKEYCFIPLQRD